MKPKTNFDGRSLRLPLTSCGPQKNVDALLVGYYGSEGLLFAGRVGTGLSEKALATLHGGMQKIKRSSCRFVALPEKGPGRWRQGITPAVMKRCTWVEPILLAQIKFTEWTSDGSSVNRSS